MNEVLYIQYQNTVFFQIMRFLFKKVPTTNNRESPIIGFSRLITVPLHLIHTQNPYDVYTTMLSLLPNIIFVCILII